MWTFAQNTEKNRVEITFAGGFGRQHDAFDAQLMAMAKRLMIANGHFDCLVDMSRSELAPQEVTERGAGAIKWCVANGLRKAAFVHSNTAGRMQIRRLSHGHEKLSYFASLADAEHWLDTIDPPSKLVARA